jgi:hypothetical protein
MDGSCQKEVGMGRQRVQWQEHARVSASSVVRLTGAELDNAVGGSHGWGQENVLESLEMHRLFTASIMIETKGKSCVHLSEMISRVSNANVGYNPAKQY